MFIYITAKFAPVWTATILKYAHVLDTKPQLNMLFARNTAFSIYQLCLQHPSFQSALPSRIIWPSTGFETKHESFTARFT